MSLHIFSGPGWLDGVCAEAGNRFVSNAALTAPGAIRRPVTIRADLPPPRAEGQTEKRWRR